MEGGCTCRSVRYRMTTKPMFVHCCHCTWCQRETGAAFALNAMIEADRVELLHGDVEVVDIPSNSGKATVAPSPRKNVRRGMACLKIIMVLVTSSSEMACF